MSYARSYNNYNTEDPPLSAREGKSLKEHVELLHIVIVRYLETVETLNKKVKALEDAAVPVEVESDTESTKEYVKTKEKPKEEPEKEDKIDRFSKIFLRVSAVSSLLIGIGLYFATREKPTTS